MQNNFDAGNIQPTYTGTANTGYNLSQLAQQAEAENQNTGWLCRACGTRNKSNSLYCSGCGKYK